MIDRPARRTDGAAADPNGRSGRYPEWLLRPLVARAGFARRIPLRHGRSYVLVDTADIDWLEANDRYVHVHVGDDVYILQQFIGVMELLLDPLCFVRIHRSLIVNAARIASVQPLGNSDFLVTLEGGTELRSSRGYAARIRRLLGLKARNGEADE